MGFIWFWIVAVMLTAYVVLDGFDLGVGILHPILARTEHDRQIMLRSIGPVWDGNEVWLLAGGGTLYFAFPALYASAFSGFYLALMIVLWLIILRGASIELRMHIEDRLWRSFFDGLFFLSSLLLAVFFGAALANVIRGVPLRADGYFFLPLWTNWRVGPEPGILDWYTIIGGVVALVALATPRCAVFGREDRGRVAGSRPRTFVHRSWIVLFAITIISLVATIAVRSDTLTNYYSYPVAFVIPVVVLASLGGIVVFLPQRSGSQSLRVFVHLSCDHAGGRGGVVVPSSAPSSTDPGATSPCELDLGTLHAAGWAGLVGGWHGPGGRLLCCHLSHVSRQSNSRWRRLRALAALSPVKTR